MVFYSWKHLITHYSYFGINFLLYLFTTEHLNYFLHHYEFKHDIEAIFIFTTYDF